MALLKKLKAGSLVENLTASVIIMIVFMVASMSFNNVFLNNSRSDDFQLKNRIAEIRYMLKNEAIEIPFNEEQDYWEVKIFTSAGILVMEVKNKRNQTTTITKGLD